MTKGIHTPVQEGSKQYPSIRQCLLQKQSATGRGFPTEATWPDWPGSHTHNMCNCLRQWQGMDGWETKPLSSSPPLSISGPSLSISIPKQAMDSRIGRIFYGQACVLSGSAPENNPSNAVPGLGKQLCDQWPPTCKNNFHARSTFNTTSSVRPHRRHFRRQVWHEIPSKKPFMFGSCSNALNK